MAYAEKTGAKHYLGRYKDVTGSSQSVRGEDGRPIRFTGKREAKHAAEEQEAKVRRGTWIDPRSGQLRLTQYFEEQWLPGNGQDRHLGPDPSNTAWLHPLSTPVRGDRACNTTPAV